MPVVGGRIIMKEADDFKRCPLGRFLFVLILIGISFGCGYRFVSSEDNIDPRIQSVFVDSFVNRTSQAGLESLFRNAFGDQILRGGRFRLAGSREEADAIIRGSIQRLTTSPVSYHQTDFAAEETITVVLDITFEEQGSKKIIWQNRNFSYSDDYQIVSRQQLAASEVVRQSALAKMAGDVAERVYSLIRSGF